MTHSIFSRPLALYSRNSTIAATLWAIAYAVICSFLLKYYSGVAGASPVWIPAGIGLGVLLTLGYRYWPFLFVGAVFGEMGGGHHLMMAMLLAAGSVVGCLVAAFILKRYSKFNHRLESIADYLFLLLASAIGSLISTSLNVQFLISNGLISSSDFLPIFQRWFTGDYFGMAFITPILLIFSMPWVVRPDRSQLLRLGATLLSSFFLGQAVFFGWGKEYVDLTDKGNLYLLLILFFGYYFGRHGAILLFTLMLIQALLGARFGEGFIGPDLFTQPGKSPIWVYLGVACIVGMIISLAEDSFRKKNESLTLATQKAAQLEEYFQKIVANMPVLMAGYDLKTHIPNYLNPFFTETLGYVTSDFSKSSSWWLLAYPDPVYRSEVEAKWNERLSESRANDSPFVPLETQTTCKDGSVKIISWGCFLVPDQLVIYGLDVTQDKQASEVLNVSSAVYRAMGEAVVINDAKNSILMANEAFQRLSGFEAEELRGMAFSELLVKRHGARSYSDIFTTLEAEGRWEGQAWLRLKGGGEILRFISIYSAFDVDGMPLQRVVLISEVTDQRKARELINQQANFDPLTGLPNRRLMFDRLDQLIKQSTRSQKSIAIAYIDLDNFKDINDSRGHDFGDQLLKGISERLRSEVRETDTVARIGGDEFVILLGELERPEIADSIIRDISKKLADPILVGGQLIYLTASIGVSMFPNDGNDGKALLLGADQAMYAAKASGRNTYQYFTTSLQIEASYRAGVIADIRVALEKKQFELYYQPIIHLKTGKVVHAEALLRWRRDNGELSLPSEFIQIAEDSGLIVEVGDWVWNEAASFMGSLNAGPNFTLAINVAAAQFNSNQQSAVAWLEALRHNRVPPQSIILEITERMMLNQSHRVMRKISMLQEAGCKFSVDDFGAGYSSLASLKSFNFDYIKIDADFIRPLEVGTQDAALVFAMISMAKGLGLECVAEGVETIEQANLLRTMSCTYAQGYLYSKPMPAEEFRTYLKSNLDA